MKGNFYEWKFVFNFASTDKINYNKSNINLKEGNIVNKEISFDVILAEATKLPTVRIDRAEFLKSALSKYFDKDTVNKAISENPAYAGISVDKIKKIARACIDYETTKVTLLSAAAGVPGGFAMFGTVPADLTQYFAHVLRILQKLIYLYGWQELFDENGQMDDGTKNLLTLFVGIMFGVNGTVGVIAKISEAAAQKAAKNFAQKALAKEVTQLTVQKVVTNLGVKITKDGVLKASSKFIPLIGAVASGGVTYVTYRPMAIKLQKHLSKMKLADPEFVKQHYGNEERTQK